MQVSTRLRSSPASARQAREFVGRALREEHADEQQDTVVLLANELVTNAILHARGDILLAVELVPGKVRIQVTDQSSQLPVHRGGVQEATSGRGLELVDALATAWGVESMSDDGKQVWCEVAS
jgi:anti-sigma regulatory factor (Ser/Thr protein kinase)